MKKIISVYLDDVEYNDFENLKLKLEFDHNFKISNSEVFKFLLRSYIDKHF